MKLRVVLVSYHGYRLEIPSNPYPMYPHAERLNCVSIDSATGQRYVFDHGPTRVNASILFRSLSHEFVRQYEDFILNVAQLGKVNFGIECPDYIDFGLGKGKDIIFAYYAGPPTLKDIITPRDDAGLYYDIELPYMFVRGR
jgi:hypothetical protein